jgi:L-rhamnose mutarotase
MTKKNTMIYIRVTEDEWDQIHKRMGEAGVKNMSAYIRKVALNGYIIRLDLSDLKEVLRLLRINSNNLNQYAKRANETGSIYLADIVELKESQKQILEKIGELLERIAGIS